MTNDKRIGGLRNSLANHSEPVRQILRVSSRLTATTDEILPPGRGAFGPTGKAMNTLNIRNNRNISVFVPSVPRFPASFPASRAKRVTPQLESGGIGCPMYKEGGKRCLYSNCRYSRPSLLFAGELSIKPNLRKRFLILKATVAGRTSGAG